MSKMTYLAFITQDPAGYGVVFPDLPGCISVGDSFEHAVEMAHEALSLYAESVREDGRALPPPRSLPQIEAAKLDWLEPDYTVAAISLR